MIIPEIMRELESYQFEEIVYAKNKNIKESLQLAEDKLEIQYI